MDDYEQLQAFLTELRRAAGKQEIRDRLDDMLFYLDRMRRRMTTLKGKLTRTTAELHEAREALHREESRHAGTKADIEKAWCDGHEQGLADGFAECSALMSHGRR